MKKELWVRLRQYRFGNLVPVTLADRVKGAFGTTDAFTRAFAAKVAKKHGWTEEFAFLAIREYKKFVYMGCVSHYDVTPSKVIDIVWHEHQLFTRGYREFCRDVLKQHFDHSPELIPFDEQTEQFSAQYQKTLAFYEHEFGVAPPAEIWGKPKFNPAVVKGLVEKPVKRRTDSSQASSDGDTPLFTMFTSGTDRGYAPVPVTFTPEQGGTFGGAGATSSWGDATGPSAAPAATPAAASCTTTTPASSCSSSGSSCSGGSSCGGGGGD